MSEKKVGRKPFPQGRTVKETEAHEVWEDSAFYFFVLKKYQKPEEEKHNPHARWLVSVRPKTQEGLLAKYGECGDGYVRNIKPCAKLMKVNPLTGKPTPGYEEVQVR